MKATINIPGKLLRRAEAAARKLGISRNRLFATAISKFLDRGPTSEITERLNRIYSKEGSELDAALYSAQIRPLEKDSW